MRAMRRPTVPGWAEGQTPTPFLYHKLDLKQIDVVGFGVSVGIELKPITIMPKNLLYNLS